MRLKEGRDDENNGEYISDQNVLYPMKMLRVKKFVLNDRRLRINDRTYGTINFCGKLIHDIFI
jgi:hypothetical protein